MPDSLPPDPATLAAAVTALTADVRAAGTVTETHLGHANALESAYAAHLDLSGYARACALLALQQLGSAGATAEEIRAFLTARATSVTSKSAAAPLIERHPLAAQVLETWWHYRRLLYPEQPALMIDYCVFVATWWRP